MPFLAAGALAQGVRDEDIHRKLEEEGTLFRREICEKMIGAGHKKEEVTVIFTADPGFDQCPALPATNLFPSARIIICQHANWQSKTRTNHTANDAHFAQNAVYGKLPMTPKVAFNHHAWRVALMALGDVRREKCWPMLKIHQGNDLF